jgi:O-antigen/teichoic acid export membrane protein
MKEPVTNLMRVHREVEPGKPPLAASGNWENLWLRAGRWVVGLPRAPVTAIIENPGRVWKHALHLVSREHALALVDQAVVSATGFLTTLLIAHWSNSNQLGVYALGLSVLLSGVGFQDSLILQPYIIQRHRHTGSEAERAGASLTLSILFSLASMFVLTIAALALTWRSTPETAAISWAVAGVVPFALTRDFARRFDFAHLATGRVLVLDLTASIIQLSALGWLGATGHMSAPGACAAIGVACALPTAIWLHQLRAEFAISRRHLRITLQQTWTLGKWLLSGRIAVQVQQYTAYWLAAVLGGAAVTGVYAACMSIVGFANPMIIGLTNVYMPRSALAWKHGGGPMLQHEAIRSAALVAGLMAVFSLAVAGGGEHVMRILYRGSDFTGHGQALIVLALAASSGALGIPASIALATMERARAIIIVTTIEAFITLALVWMLMAPLGLLGAAYGMLGGNVCGAIGRWIAFYLLVPKAYGNSQAEILNSCALPSWRQQETV